MIVKNSGVEIMAGGMSGSPFQEETKQYENSVEQSEVPVEKSAIKETVLEILEPALRQQKEISDLLSEVCMPEISELKDLYPGILQDITVASAKYDDSFIQIEKQLQETLKIWEKTQKELEKRSKELQEGIEYAERKLLSEKTPFKDWGKYGWTISFNARPKDYYYVPKSKEDADEYMSRIHNDGATQKTIERLKGSSYLKQKDIDEIAFLFANEKYKACALMLFSLIDSLLIHTQDKSNYAGNRKQGNRAIERYEELAGPENKKQLTTRVLSFVSSVEALKAFFAEGENFQINNPVLNRHLICHGMLQREVNKTDCTQLLLLYENMLHCMKMI